MSDTLETAVFGGGCFWCIEAVFQQLRGVHEAIPGYAGGDRDQPTYKEVCTGRTGHAEVIRVRFDPDVVGYRELLEVLFSIHDPTQRNRQGNDVGPQYRSCIMPQDEEQERIARDFISAQDAAGVWSAPVVTTVEPGATFWPAEAEHHDFYLRNTMQPYCQVMITPKLEHARTRFPERVAS